MFKYEDSIIVNYPIDKVYQLVSKVEDYPKFIPWCSTAELIKQDEDGYCYYRLVAKFHLFTKEFITKDKFDKNEKITIELVEGTFKKLNSIWEFKEVAENQTKVKFFIAFEFNSIILTKLLGKVFLEANKKILTSFLNQLDNINTKIV